jgi:hypothetical protein
MLAVWIVLKLAVVGYYACAGVAVGKSPKLTRPHYHIIIF